MVYDGTIGMRTGKKECKARPRAGKIRIVLYHLIVKHVKLHDMIAAVLGQNQYEIASSLSLLAMTLRKWFCHCGELEPRVQRGGSEAISRDYKFTENS